MWLCIMHHIHLFTLSGSSPLVALPCLGTPPSTQPYFLGWAGDSLAWLTQPGKPLTRAESNRNKQWWLGGGFVFATRIYQLFTEIKTKPLSQRCLMFWGSVSERINIILFVLLWLQKPVTSRVWQSKQFSLCSCVCSGCFSVSQSNAYKFSQPSLEKPLFNNTA